jgi:hypothetical protein
MKSRIKKRDGIENKARTVKGIMRLIVMRTAYKVKF